MNRYSLGQGERTTFSEERKKRRGELSIKLVQWSKGGKERSYEQGWHFDASGGDWGTGGGHSLDRGEGGGIGVGGGASGGVGWRGKKTGKEHHTELS